MGDENSLAGTTKAHKHSALSSDGGFLETSVTGVTNLSEGSIVYGNASEIVTELTAGSEGTALQISSGVPAWVAGGSTTETCYSVVSLSEDGIGNDKPLYGVEINDSSSPIYGKTLIDVSFWLRKNGSPTGDGYVYVYDSDGTLQATSNSPIEWNNLGSGWEKITFTISHTIDVGDRIVIGGGDIGIGKEVSFYGDQSSSHTTFQSLVEYETSSGNWLTFNSGVSGARWCYTA